MIVIAWNNGMHNRNGSGYGFKVHIQDRDAFFKKEWKTILLEIEGEPKEVEINIEKPDFWDENCRELTCLAIGKWLRRNGLAPWPRGNPPVFALNPVEENRFKVSKAVVKQNKL